LRIIKNHIAVYSDTIVQKRTMPIKDFYNTLDEVYKIGEFLITLNCKASFFTTPVRPPAKKYAIAPDGKRLDELAEYIKKKISASEILLNARRLEYKTAGNIESEILNIMSVHPINFDSLENIYKSQGGNSSNIKDLIRRGVIKEMSYDGVSFIYKGKMAKSY
jgi:wyosine [tRNA(Phe)-imidazoG37] synthetase (radical SAM superfamily)